MENYIKITTANQAIQRMLPIGRTAYLFVNGIVIKGIFGYGTVPSLRQD